MDKTKEAKIYHKIKHRLFFLNLFVDTIVLWLFFISGLSESLRNFSLGCSSYSLAANGIYIAIFLCAMAVVHLPFSYFEGFVWEHRFNLSNQRFFHWFTDELKKTLMNITVGMLTIEFIYISLRQFPNHWWIGAGIFWLILTLVLAKLMPNVIIPLFFKYSSIQNQELRERILGLFKRVGVAIQDAYLINFSAKTKKANAFICGLGKNRRVVLSDTLASEFSIGQIETVVAHELGHYKNHDILKTSVVNSLVTFAGFFLMDRFLKASLAYFGLRRIDDIAFFPILALAFIVFGFTVMPIVNGYSRKIEVKADRFSLQLTKNADDFISMMQKLGLKNLSDFEPGVLTKIFFYDHPPILKRIKCAENFKLSAGPNA